MAVQRRALQLEGKDVTKQELNTILKQVVDRILALEDAGETASTSSSSTSSGTSLSAGFSSAGLSGSFYTWGTENFNTSGGVISRQNGNQEIIVSQAGQYHLDWRVAANADGSGILQVNILKNGVAQKFWYSNALNASAFFTLCDGMIMDLLANEYLSIQVITGTAVADSAYNTFSIEKLP